MPLADGDKLHLECAIIGSIADAGGDSQITVTPLHYQRTNTPAPYSASAFIAAFHTAVKTAWKACASEKWMWEKTVVRILNSPAEASVEATVAEAGTVAEEPVPGFVAAIISKKTPLRGRKYQGRIFFPGIPVTGILGNELTTAHVTLLTTLRTALLANITEAGASTWAPSLLSRSLSDLTVDPSMVTMTQITSMPVRHVLGRQSQRKSRVI